MANRAEASKRQYLLTCLAFGAIIIAIHNIFILDQPLEFFAADDRRTKYVLYWMKLFGDRGFYLGLGSNIFENCTYKNCFTTDNKSLLPIEKFNAILFYAPEYKNDIMKNRSPEQVYVYDNQESPSNTPVYMTYPKGFFNWTMTYRTDSDIIRAYGYVKKQDTKYQLPTVEQIRKRPRKIAWFVSNCMTQSKRENLAREINKHYQIDIYGRCGDLYCAKKRHTECLKMVEDNYKYYYSAENSLCVDYVSEKLYNALTLDIVPIAYGGARYDKLSPPHSIIDVSSFESVDELVDYLHFLDENPTAYLQYFEWKQQYIIDMTSQMTLCTLCEKLHKPLQHKYYSDISNWWFGDNSSTCRYGKHMPNIVKSMIKNDSDYLEYINQ